jgi:hypothetical protein
MQSSSEIKAILEVGATSMHNFPVVEMINSKNATHTNNWAKFLAFLSALLWFTFI